MLVSELSVICISVSTSNKRCTGCKYDVDVSAVSHLQCAMTHLASATRDAQPAHVRAVSHLQCTMTHLQEMHKLPISELSVTCNASSSTVGINYRRYTGCRCVSCQPPAIHQHPDMTSYTRDIFGLLRSGLSVIDGLCVTSASG